MYKIVVLSRECPWGTDPFLIDFGFLECQNVPRECLKEVRDIVGKPLKQGFRNSKVGLLGCAWSTMKGRWNRLGTAQHDCDIKGGLWGRISTFETNLLAGACLSGPNCLLVRFHYYFGTFRLGFFLRIPKNHDFKDGEICGIARCIA